MSIQDQLNDDLKTAMKAHDEVTKNTIRLMRSSIKNVEIDKGGAIDDAGVTDVLARMAKQYRDSITTFRDAGRTDLVDKEQAELDVLMRYMPKQLGADEVRAIAQQTADEVGAQGPQDKGKLMGKLMPKVKGQADGAIVNQVVTEILEARAAGKV